MNVYISLRIVFYSLLSVNNLLALTAAAWSISVSSGEASPGAVLVIIGCVGFIILSFMTWAEICFPGTQLSRVRTEIALVPILIVFQLISGAVATSDMIQSVCRDTASCVALLVLSWITPFSLIVYYFMVLAVAFEHAKIESSVWNASFLEHPWFLRPPPPPPKETNVPMQRFSITPPLSLRTRPFVTDHRRQRSSWMPPSSPAPPNEPVPTFPFSLYSQQGSAKSHLLPTWARGLRPLQRGLELPFPVRTAAPPGRHEDPRCIDAPVSPTAYTE